MIRIGMAGWSITAACRDSFPAKGTQLQRYAALMSAVEINSSFHRSHRRQTYERWAASVPANFRFAVKLPRTITHDQRLNDIDQLVAQFAGEVSGLGDKLGVVLVQLPPSLAFAGSVATLELVRRRLGCPVVLEARHESWFTEEVSEQLATARIGRVIADPPAKACDTMSAGWSGSPYFRLHGRPRIYWSRYEHGDLEKWEAEVRNAAPPSGVVWVIFDNTAAGAALDNALEFAAMMRRPGAL